MMAPAFHPLKAIHVTDEASEEETDEGDEPEVRSDRAKEESGSKRREIAKRANKHAPMEMTSKRAVTRRRTVVEVKTPKARDPRFLPLTGDFSATRFQNHYGFLADMHSTELATLRENVKRARKMLAPSPRDLREEREQEVQRLELAMKRAESMVTKDKREKVEQEALGRVAKEEQEKRKQGKGGWWMKESDKKKLLVRARYDALAAAGGKGAVKKAIEKKQRKIGQKEKRSRPFGLGKSGEENPGSTKRSSDFSQSEEGRFRKRRRVA